MTPAKLALSILVVTLVVSGLGQANPAQAQEKFAAVAYSTDTGAWGYSYGCDSQSEAEDLARTDAHDETARPRAWVRDGYIALAVSRDGEKFYGWGYGDTPEEARRLALEEVRKRTTNCYIAVCVHSELGNLSLISAPVVEDNDAL